MKWRWWLWWWIHVDDLCYYIVLFHTLKKRNIWNISLFFLLSTSHLPIRDITLPSNPNPSSYLSTSYKEKEKNDIPILLQILVHRPHPRLLAFPPRHTHLEEFTARQPRLRSNHIPPTFPRYLNHISEQHVHETSAHGCAGTDWMEYSYCHVCD